MENQKAIANGEVIGEKDVKMKKANLEVKVIKLLDELGIPVKWSGYNYLVTAIVLCIEDNTYSVDTCQKLYPEVAKQYNVKNPLNIERTIRYAIEMVWKEGNKELLSEILSYTVDCEKGKPTPAEFIGIIAEKLYLQSDEVSDIERKVANMLFEFGISPKLKGYFYLKSAILLQLQECDFKNFSMCNLYLDLAKLYGTNWSGIERGIRTALAISWERGNVKIIHNFFPGTLEHNAVPTNSTFIKTIINKLRYELY